MPATNLEELFDFETAFESAAQAILVSSGIAAFISQQSEKLPLLNTAIGFDVGPAIDQLTQIPKPTTWSVGAPPPQEYFRYNGQLEFTVEVPRDDNRASLPGVDTMLAQARGKIRAAMMLCVMPFNQANLPFYRVSDIRPQGATTGFSLARNIDFCSLKFALTWAIQSTAWPAWVETGP